MVSESWVSLKHKAPPFVSVHSFAYNRGQSEEGESSPLTVAEKTDFWCEESRRALSVARDLVGTGTYLEALFFAHLALEKVLKAHIVRPTAAEPVFSHDLVLLADRAQISLSDEDRDFFARVNAYNIRARYQDYKRALYHRASKEYVECELDAISRVHRSLEEQLQ